MVAQQQGQESDQARDSQRRRATIAACLAGFFAALAFFAFFPGLPTSSTGEPSSSPWPWEHWPSGAAGPG